MLIHIYKKMNVFTFQTTVLSVRQRQDFTHTGQWEVVTENQDGHKEAQVFDAVFVCVGSFTHPVTPLSSFPGIFLLPLFIPKRHIDFTISLILSHFFSRNRHVSREDLPQLGV